MVASNGHFVGIRALNRARPKSVRDPWMDGDEKDSAYPVNVIQPGARLSSQTVGARFGEISCLVWHLARAKTLENNKKMYNRKPIATHREAKIGSNFSRLLVARK